MGLFSWLSPPRRKRKPQRYAVERVHVNRQGYDRRGHYWGVGERLYRVTDMQENRDKWVRAPSAKAARNKAVSDKYGWR